MRDLYRLMNHEEVMYGFGFKGFGFYLKDHGTL